MIALGWVSTRWRYGARVDHVAEGRWRWKVVTSGARESWAGIARSQAAAVAAAVRRGREMGGQG